MLNGKCACTVLTCSLVCITRSISDTNQRVRKYCTKRTSMWHCLCCVHTEIFFSRKLVHYLTLQKATYVNACESCFDIVLTDFSE